MEEVGTNKIIVEYMIKYLKQKDLEFKRRHEPDADNINGDQTSRIEMSLLDISRDLREFISRSHNERFKQMMESVNDNNLRYEDFKTLADELFSEGISWFKIVTFLVFSGELAGKALINGQNEEVVHQICESISKYIDENLLQWINEQDGGWLNVVSFAGEISNKPYNYSHKSMRQYFRMATCAAFIGGLYLCSKFILQK